MFLPREGPSWVCGCPPGSKHTCSPEARSKYLLIRLKSPAQPAIARIRMAVYYEKNLIQSQLLTAEVVKAGEAGDGYHSWIDYTPTTKLTDLSSLPPRTLNILTNENTDGSHLVMINGPGCDLEFHPTEGQMRETVEPARESLRRIHFREYGGQGGTVKQPRESLRCQEFKGRQSAFIEDSENVGDPRTTTLAVTF